MKKIGFMAGALSASLVGLMAYSLMNKKTSKKADQLLCDVIKKTDDLVKGNH